MTLPSVLDPTSYDVLVLIVPAVQSEAASTAMAALHDQPPSPVPVMIAFLGTPEEQHAAAERAGRGLHSPLREPEPGLPLTPGGVYLAPPQSLLEFQPGLRCALTAREAGSSARPLDRLLRSLARTAGPRALAVVLGGEGPDGLDGARALHALGGTLLVMRSADGLPADLTLTRAATLTLSPALLGSVVADLLGAGRNPVSPPAPESALPVGGFPEARMSAVLAGLDDGVYLAEAVLDADGHCKDIRCLDENPAAVRMAGSSLKGRLLSEVGDPALDWREIVGAALRTRQPQRFERAAGPDGPWYHVHVFKAEDGVANHVALVFRDVTERRCMLRSLKENEARQAFLLTLSDTLRPLNDPLEIQREAARVLGQHFGASRAAYAEVEADNADFLVHHDHTDAAPSAAPGRELLDSYGPEVIRDLRAGHTVWTPDVDRDPRFGEKERARLAAGSIRAFIGVPLVKKGRLAAVLSLHHPAPYAWTPPQAALVEETAERTWAAVERARADAARRATEARFRAVANLVPDLLGECGPDGIALWYNQRWLEYTGQSQQEVSGWGWMEAIHPEDRDLAARRYRQAAQTGEPSRQVHRLRRHDGEYRWFVIHTFPLRDALGTVTRVYAAATDIHHLHVKTTVLEAAVEERTLHLAELNAELELRTRALEAFRDLTHSLTAQLDPYELVRRAQDVALSLLPAGFAAYYEPEGGLWRLKAQKGDLRHPALQAAVDEGLTIGGSPSLDRPWQSGAPSYQGLYAPDTDGLGELGDSMHAAASLLLLVGDRPLGVFAVALFERREWTRADRAVLETVVRSLSLALEGAQAIQAVAEEREALAAFAQFTELAADTGDVATLAERAAEVLHASLNVRNAVYFELEGDRWMVRHLSGTPPNGARQVVLEGLPAQTRSLALPAERREVMFFEPFDAELDGLAAAAVPYRVVARYPMFPTDRPVGMLGMADTDRATWTEREKAIFRAVGHSFRLALERTARLQQIEQQRERLADLNAELGTLITRTAHNLEEPARRLSALLDPGRNVTPTDLPAYDPALLQDEINRLRGVADDLRHLSSLEARPLATDLLPLRELFQDALGARTAPGDGRVHWMIAPLPIIRADRAMLRQALDVLLTFTLSATRGAGYVSVTCRTVGGEVQIVVQDDGVGLASEEAATLFDLAVRTDQGVPLLEGGGLMQVRRVLARHGGWAWAEVTGHGGKVILAFPQDAAVGELEAWFEEGGAGT